MIGQRCAELARRKASRAEASDQRLPYVVLVALVQVCKAVCDQTATRLPPEVTLLGMGVAQGTAKSL